MSANDTDILVRFSGHRRGAIGAPQNFELRIPGINQHDALAGNTVPVGSPCSVSGWLLVYLYEHFEHLSQPRWRCADARNVDYWNKVW